MKPELLPGVSHEINEPTEEKHAAPHLAAEGRLVFSTPSMIGFMERCSVALLKPYLEEGESSVGYKVNITHLAGTPIGQKVRVISKVESIEGRRVTFNVEAHNEKEKIGEGTHTRVIIKRK